MVRMETVKHNYPQQNRKGRKEGKKKIIISEEAKHMPDLNGRDGQVCGHNKMSMEDGAHTLTWDDRGDRDGAG